MDQNRHTRIPDRLSDDEYKSLTERILSILMEKGMKATTMDLVASRLQMSKRTLYEIFSSKSQMILEVLRLIGQQHQDFILRTFEESPDTLDAILTIYIRHRDMLRRTSPEFFRDMDHFYKNERACYDQESELRHNQMLRIIQRGVEQGQFRPDVDYSVHLRIMGIQMESLKRMEEFFPPDIGFLRVYDAIILGFLRSIVSPEGMKRLDSISSSLLH